MPSEQNKDSVLTCTVKKSSDKAKTVYTWVKKQEGDSYLPIEGSAGATYTFTPSAISDSGDYACQGQVSEDGVSSTPDQSGDAAVNVFC